MTDLVEKDRHHNYGQIIQDLYKILKKLSAENKSLKQSVIDHQEIIELEVNINICLLNFYYKKIKTLLLFIQNQEMRLQILDQQVR